MPFETCPLLDELPWIRHGFFDARTPFALTKPLVGIVAFSADYPQAIFLSQTHSDRVLTTEDDLSVSADGLITDKTGVALAIKTADCCPLMIVCPSTRQIANVHAGWRGALNGIALHTVDKMVANGAEADKLIVAIGPSIFGENYPVQDDVRDQFAAERPEALPFFLRFEDRWKVDVADIVRHQLTNTGLKHIWKSDIDTFGSNEYASYRRYTADRSLPDARNISILMKREV